MHQRSSVAGNRALLPVGAKDTTVKSREKPVVHSIKSPKTDAVMPLFLQSNSRAGSGWCLMFHQIKNWAPWLGKVVPEWHRGLVD